MPDLTGRHLVDTQWLAAHLAAPDLVILDASWYLPAEGRDPRCEYDQAHIPGARFFDIDAISDRASPLPHMLPPAAQFAAQVQRLGIGDDAAVVAYDGSTQGLFSAARAWWMFRVMGHENVAVLDGGLKKWRAEGLPLTDDVPTPAVAASFTRSPNPQLLRSLADMRALIASGDEQIADARAPGRFAGQDREPRPGLRSGHMPGARNLPFATVLEADGTLKSVAQLQAQFDAAGIVPSRPIVTTCGSGVTAAVLSLALAVMGNSETGLYDGSWSEWGQDQLDTEVVQAD